MNLLCWVGDFLNGEWTFLYQNFMKAGRTSSLGRGRRKVGPPRLPGEVEGEDRLFQETLSHQRIQWGLNSFHGQIGKPEAQYPIEVSENEDQAGFPQSLPESHRCTRDSPNLEKDSNGANYFWEDSPYVTLRAPQPRRQTRGGDIWNQLHLPQKPRLPT